MIVGVPTETKRDENRVAITPAGVHEFVRAGHTVLVQAGAGEGSRVPDAEFSGAGATIVAEAADAWSAALVCKVKEPQRDEFVHLRRDLTLFTYLHLAAYPAVAAALVASGCTAIAYETVQDAHGQIGRRRQHFVGANTAFLIDDDDIDKGAADIDADGDAWNDCFTHSRRNSPNGIST